MDAAGDWTVSRRLWHRARRCQAKCGASSVLVVSEVDAVGVRAGTEGLVLLLHAKLDGAMRARQTRHDNVFIALVKI